MDAKRQREPVEGAASRSAQGLCAWPLLLTREQACAYLSVSPVTFQKICPVPAVALGAAVTRWNRNQIDEWVNSLPPKNAVQQTAMAEIARPYDVAKEASEARRQASLQKNPRAHT